MKRLSSYTAAELYAAAKKAQGRELAARLKVARATLASYPESVKVGAHTLPRIPVRGNGNEAPGYERVIAGPVSHFTTLRINLYSSNWTWRVEVAPSPNLQAYHVMNGRDFSPPLRGIRGLETCVRDLEHTLCRVRDFVCQVVPP